MALRTLLPRPVVWKIVSGLSAVIGGIVARKVVEKVWTTVSGRDEPPQNPADRSVGWGAGLQWAVAAGVGAGIGRLVSQRFAAKEWERATGETPPGIDA